MNGATDVFLWFLISNIDELKTFKPKCFENKNKWVYTDTALQILTSLKSDHTVLAQSAATALGAINFQKNEMVEEAGAGVEIGSRLG